MGWPTPVRAVRQRSSVVRSSLARVKPVERARVVFEKSEAAPVFERSDLPTAHILKGPAVITEYSATTAIPPGKEFWVDSEGNLIIEMKGARRN
jgi:N-methylhydantoinase A/oxoprolinase/acetone carboxylase beta subunit